MLKLKAALQDAGRSQSELARAVNLSNAAIAQIVNHNLWPKRREKAVLQGEIIEFLGGTADAGLFEEVGRATGGSRDATSEPSQSKDLEIDMLLRKQTLSPEARRAFGLSQDPFAEPRSADDVFLNGDFRYVRESLRQTAKHGGFIAVVGESGAGKSTLRRDLAEWIQREQEAVIMIEPYVLGMEDNDVKGKTLKATHIAEAIMSAVAPREHVKRSPEARFRQIHDALRESHRAGNRHVLVIEEAHSLPIPTLKHLKRFFELEDGFAKLLGIVLIGQSELGQKLDERSPSVREVVQRCEVVTLRPLDQDLDAYLRHRFSMAHRSIDDLLEADATDALRTKLSGRNNTSVLYPLAVHNVLAAAFNEAATLGIPRVSGDLIQGV